MARSRVTRKAQKTGTAAKRGRLRPRWPLSLALGVVLVLGVVLRVGHLGDVRSRSPDERFYTHFAANIANHGLGVTRTFFATYESDSTTWSYPGPNRIGYVLLVTLAMKLANNRDEGSGVAISCLFSILSLLLVAWIGLRFFGGWVAVGAVAFLGFSAGELGTAPRAWVDATFGFFSLLLLYITCEITRAPRRILWYLAFFVTGMLLLLMKQPGVVSYGVCSLWLMWVVLRHERWWQGGALLVGGALLSIALTIGIWGMLAGGVGVALSTLDHSFRLATAAQVYAEDVSTGPWYRFFHLLWVVGPLTAALALMGVLVGFFRRGHYSTAVEARAATAAALVTLGFIGFCSFVPGMQNLRYFCPVDGAYCLLAALGFAYLMSRARRMLPEPGYRTLVVATVAAVAWLLVRDHNTFASVVLRSGMEDVPAKWILEEMERLKQG